MFKDESEFPRHEAAVDSSPDLGVSIANPGRVGEDTLPQVGNSCSNWLVILCLRIPGRDTANMRGREAAIE